MRIAVIPARGGSKRIPRKNIRPFNGLPMIAWSINAALESDCFDRVIVSTDDKEIADVAKLYGAEVPFLRPASLSDDYAGTIAVITHAIKWLTSRGESVDDVCCIYATAPFVTAHDLKLGQDLLHQANAHYSFTVTSYAFPIQRAIRITPNHRVEMINPGLASTRSQDLEPCWHDAGQFYWGKPEAWLSKEPIFGPNSVPVILPRYRVQDIDTEEDWERAEIMFKILKKIKENI